MLRNTFVLLSVGLVATLVACSDATHPAANTPEAGLVCPTTVSSAASTKCTKDGYSCAVGYLCPGAVWQQAQCTCKGGVFSCVDATGADVAGNAAPNCAPVPKPTESCGASVDAMNAKVCKTAGLSCTFAGATCPNGKAAQDVCVCFPSEDETDAGAGVLTWRCEPGPCPKPQ